MIFMLSVMSVPFALVRAGGGTAVFGGCNRLVVSIGVAPHR